MSKLSKFVFCVYIVFVLVGSAMPFQDPDPADRVDSNPINQIVDSVLPLIALVCLLPKRRQAIVLLRQEKFLVIFLAWCALSIFWSEFPLKSAKACFRMAGAATVILSFLVNARSSSEALKCVRGILALYIPLSLLSVVAVPGAVQPESDAWRGLSGHKNTLGEISLISSILWATAIPSVTGVKKLLAWLLLGGSLLLLWGAQSMTSLVTLLVIGGLALCIVLNRKLGQIALAPTAACCVMGMLLLTSDLPAEMIGSLGRDTTFTGRTDIWSSIVDEIRDHPIVGCGFGGFWLEDNRSVQVLYDQPELAWGPVTAHEGYLDIMNETGAIGLLFVALMVAGYFYRTRQPGRNVWPWFVGAILIVNFTESSLFRTGSFAAWVFLLSYLATHADRMSESFAKSRTEAMA
jgi:exopolysaccharide production protein ExoQ